VKTTGECFCGGVKYQIEGPLGETRSCHCSRCRKAFNAQASAAARVNPDQFSWLCGEELLTSYVNQQGYGLRFCRVCGSTVCTIYGNDVLQVTLGCLNDTDAIKMDMHIYVGSAMAWEEIPPGVPQHVEGPPA
jgi:hypothetical protein